MDVDLLPANAVHVWYTLAPHELAGNVVAELRGLLADDERARHKRFIQEKDRRQYLLGKALVRTVLSRYLGGSPREWVFTTNNHGKPVLANGPSPRAFHFNLSHTEGLIACAVAWDREVGIDVENLERSASLDVARRYFAPAEVAHLEQLPESERRLAFFLFWTLKEAYVKAQGQGLSLPLEKFSFRLHGPKAPAITFESDMADDPAYWRFFLPPLNPPLHQAAVAVRCPRPGPLALETRPLALSALSAQKQQG